MKNFIIFKPSRFFRRMIYHKFCWIKITKHFHLLDNSFQKSIINNLSKETINLFSSGDKFSCLISW
jgi:hypothetical protein